MSEARKDDAGKPRMDLIPAEVMAAMGECFTYGADKYADRNWEKGLPWGRVFAALQRHLWAWWGGEETDKESGLSHLSHAACCVAMLVATVERQRGADTRHIDEGEARGLTTCTDR